MSTTTTNGRPREARVVAEPLTYEHRGPNSRHSLFQDMANAELNHSADARARLERHRDEMRIELPRLERRQPGEVEYERRVNPSRVEADGGTFAPPLWANQYFATAPRPKRVLAGMIPGFDLPAGVSSVNLPRMTQGAETGAPADLAGVVEQDVLTQAVESPAMVVDGMSDWPMQSLEQSPAGAHLDFCVLKDLGESSDAKLEEKLFTGAGKSQEITGILNLKTGPGLVSAVTYTNATPKGYELFVELGKVAGQLGDARNLPPECWLMRTARWAWTGSSTDEEKLPLAVPGHQALAPVQYTFDDARPAPAPPILGWPTYLDDAIPATLGVGKNQDVIVAIRPSDMMLFESPQSTLTAVEPLSGTLQVRFLMHKYAAVLWRYPTGIATLTGTGLVVPSEE